MEEKYNHLDTGLSIIIPVYNAIKSINVCLDSILNQTFNRLQVICVNDGSNDDSLKLIRDYAKIDSRITVIDQKNAGVSAARNMGIRAAKYAYIAFVDADDEVEVTMYEEMIKQIIRQGSDCVCCGHKIIKRNEIKECYPPVNMEELNGRQAIVDTLIKPMLGFCTAVSPALNAVWGKIFKKSIIVDNHIQFNQNRNNGEDWEFCIEYFSFCQTIGFLHKALYRYSCLNTDSLTSRFRENILELALEDRKKFSALYPELEWKSEEKIWVYLNAPFIATRHYQSHLYGAELQKKLKRAVSLCIYDELWIEYAEQRGGKWKRFLNNPQNLLKALKITAWFVSFKKKVMHLFTLSVRYIKQLFN